MDEAGGLVKRKSKIRIKETENGIEIKIEKDFVVNDLANETIGKLKEQRGFYAAIELDDRVSKLYPNFLINFG